MQKISADTCKRHRVEIDGENYYIVMDDKLVHVTVPHENWPGKEDERKAVDILCQKVLDIANGVCP